MGKTVLEQAFGESAVLKILDVLMEHPSMDYSKKDLADAAEVSESTVHRCWSRIQELDATEKTRKYGGTQLYKLNQGSEIVKQLYRLDQELRDQKKKVEASMQD
jgi:DNA-binding IclR family transcriptional regulator